MLKKTNSSQDTFNQLVPSDHIDKYIDFDYIYDNENDFFTCPNKKILKPINVTRDGYKVYKKKEYLTCPLKDECLGNSKKEYRDITRHIHDDIKDRARERRLSTFGKNIAKRRSHTVERSFADAKQNHGYRFARRKGLVKNQDDSWLLK